MRQGYSNVLFLTNLQEMSLPGLLRLMVGVIVLYLPFQGGVMGEEVETGRRIYNFRCYFCHGYAGDARTLAAKFLRPPPRNFSATPIEALSRTDMLDAVREGRANTAMKSFSTILTPREIDAVVDFIRAEFMKGGKTNTRYHTPENGWENHDRYAAAFPFATGQIALDTPWEDLTEVERAGKRLYLESCISCHDRSRVSEERVTWERQAFSYPRFGFQPGDAQKRPDAISGASPFARHDVPLKIDGLSAQELEGERLYLANCAFCHAADGTGKNWIGRFLQPHPRDLTDPAAMGKTTRAAVRRVIREGLPGTSMPAWRTVLNDQEIEAVIAYMARAFHPLASHLVKPKSGSP